MATEAPGYGPSTAIGALERWRNFAAGIVGSAVPRDRLVWYATDCFATPSSELSISSTSGSGVYADYVGASMSGVWAVMPNGGGAGWHSVKAGIGSTPAPDSWIRVPVGAGGSWAIGFRFGMRAPNLSNVKFGPLVADSSALTAGVAVPNKRMVVGFDAAVSAANISAWSAAGSIVSGTAIDTSGATKYDVALVRASGTTTLHVNGVIAGQSANVYPDTDGKFFPCFAESINAGTAVQVSYDYVWLMTDRSA